MMDIIRLLLFPLLALIGWMLSSRRAEIARKAARVLYLSTAILFLAIVATGWMRTEAASDRHKWAGHAMVIALWLFTPFALGVGLQQHIRQRPLLALAMTLTLLILLGIGLLALLTGYIGPTHIENITAETYNRFRILHLFALPSLIAFILFACYKMFRPRKLDTPVEAANE